MGCSLQRILVSIRAWRYLLDIRISDKYQQLILTKALACIIGRKTAVSPGLLTAPLWYHHLQEQKISALHWTVLQYGNMTVRGCLSGLRMVDKEVTELEREITSVSDNTVYTVV